MYDDILVPVDGSDCSFAALERAEDLAATYGATLHVVSVADVRTTFGDSPTDFDPGQVVDFARKRAQMAVDDAVDRVGGDLEVREEVVAGIPAEDIVEYANAEGIDMIVMGTHGRSGLNRVLLGSVTERVVRTSPVPVLTVRE